MALRGFKNMLRTLPASLLIVLAVAASIVSAQDSPFKRLEIFSTLSQPPASEPSRESHLIRGVRSLGGRSALAYTDRTIFRTEDGGQNWQVLPLTLRNTERIASVNIDAGRFLAVIGNDSEMLLVESVDGGRTWSTARLGLPSFEDIEADPASAKLSLAGGSMMLSFRLQTSSNFVGIAEYRSDDDGRRGAARRRSISVVMIRLKAFYRWAWTLENIGDVLAQSRCYQRSVLKFAGAKRYRKR